MPDGRELAIRVLRPEIEAAFARDLDLARWAATKIEHARPELHRLRLVGAIDTIIRSVESEMDLRFEAVAKSSLKICQWTSVLPMPMTALDVHKPTVMATEWINATPLNELNLAGNELI